VSHAAKWASDEGMTRGGKQEKTAQAIKQGKTA
jgi:hypothetical protein